MMLVFVNIPLLITAILLPLMAFLFWTDPKRGLRETTHRAECLPAVMAGQYLALAALAIGILNFADLKMTAFFFVVCAFLGLVDAAIYVRAGHSYIKHTLAGVLALVAFAITLTALFTNGDAA
ncbi:MAG: hypothetical protein ABJO67_11530 [Pseudoruegeria sp.]